jgi:glucans biosynthesis protein
MTRNIIRPPAPSRRGILAALIGAGAAPRAFGASSAWPSEVPLGPPRPFSFEMLERRARALARSPFSPPPAPPAALTRAIDYDAFGRIVYRPEATVWGNKPGFGGVRFFPLGKPAPEPVEIFVVENGRAREVLYSPGLFDAPADSPLADLGYHAGFGGLKLMNADHRTDWLAFLGASYFRAADPFNQYGLSARAIAIDTAEAKPEEFPIFRAIWIEEPHDGPLSLCALLDGPSLCGALRIFCERGPEGLVQDIDVELTFRAAVSRLGVAPLTSMYWYDANDRTPADDWRPRIHDSDGLSIWTGAGERIWRPLADPPRVIVNAFADRGPRGFGLMQRDRLFADYQDDGVFYNRRPSAWVEPVGDWGAGSVQLVEIPTSGESEDNIVAFWTPAKPVEAGQSLPFRYRLHWTDEEPTPIGVARVVATRSGRGGRPGQPVPPGRRKLVADFAGGALAGLGRASGVEAMVQVSRGQPLDLACYPVAGTKLWRLMFDIEVPSGPPIDVRAFLRRGGDALTETWIDQIFPA